MREIIFDTETTGLDPNADRVIEIGAIELVNRFASGRSFHVYINPDGREVHPEALAVHGISNAQLLDKPKFAAIVDDFLAFVGDGKLIAHNAGFDMGFINAELGRLGQPPFAPDRVIDSLALARRRHPMGPNSLDALCKRYGVDNSHRTKHGALLDSELLAEVYIELAGGRQAALGLTVEVDPRPSRGGGAAGPATIGPRPVPLPPRLDAEAEAAHARMVAKLGDGALWKRYLQ
ncbi:MAG TPA: DNA polymerase III subunit epsilon [Rhizobiaceae bacterium]|nr:DNA polymerase III subunit epsilon [Rhizobiaceae bacterium]